ncbi:MAG: RidA family protein [Anaerolineales bacterium]|nr:RidA family protein [Anaerolineales bacterium]
MQKEIIFTEKAPAVVGPYSQGVKAGNLLFTAGQIALSPSTGKMVTGSVAEETEQVMQNLQAVLQAAGTNFEHTVKATVLLGDMSYFAEMNQVYGKYMGDKPPARTTYQAGALPLGAKVEIELVVIVNG